LTRERSLRVRLSDEELKHVEEVKEAIGVPTLGEALRFIVQYSKWTSRGERILIPEELLKYLRREEGGKRRG